MAVPKSPPILIFGKLSNKYTVDLIKKILNALGQRTVSGKLQSRRRDALLERLRSVERDLTEVERQSIQHLLKSNSAITQNRFVEEVKTLVKNKTKLECQICAEVKPSSCFHVGKISPSCSHISPVCKSCLRVYINVQLNDKDWQAIGCIICSSTLPTDTIKLYTTSEVFERQAILQPTNWLD